jgi:hypothetical protein
MVPFETETKLTNILLSMREYQKQNEIKSKCVDNCQFTRDVLTPYFGNRIQVKPVIVLHNEVEGSTAICIHLVIQFDDTIIEPSYEYFKIKDKHYIDNLIHLTEIMKSNCVDNCQFTRDFKKMYKENVENFIKFIKIADEMNKGIFKITDKKYYDNQINFIEKENHIIISS